MFFGSPKPVIGKASGLVRLPLEDVYQFVAEDFFENYPRWSSEVIDLKKLSDGPLKVGSLMRQIRVDHGRKSDSTFRITDLLPDSRIAFEGVSNKYRCIYDFEEPNGSSALTRVTFTFEFPELEPILRPFEKLVRVAVQDGADRTVKNLKGLIEREAPSA
ncbi:MAG: SRPBCC family protein [Methylococcaceae bacterium]|jgi:hypothetical protein|nr:SRPBCC family protein [Methylococcaceae bacterium]